jgi:hypothetical protein
MKRSRGRGRRQSNPANRSYESNGPEVRVRGSASQVYEKYQALARDAQSSGDRVMAENLMQHAEHYYRILLTIQPPRQDATSDEDGDDQDEGDDTVELETAAAPSEEDADGEAAYEPLVLSRGEKANEDDSDKAAKGGRRRGPLRRRRDSKANGEDSGDALESAVGE